MQKPRVGVHEVIERMIEAIGQKEAGDPRAGTKIVADFLGVGKSTVYKWTDPDQLGDMSFVQMCKLAEFYRVCLGATHLAHMTGGVFVQVEPAYPSKKVWHHAARDIGTDTADALGGLMLALEDDGDVDPDEIKAHRLRALVKEAMRELASLDHNLERVEKGEAPEATVTPMRKAGAAA